MVQHTELILQHAVLKKSAFSAGWHHHCSHFTNKSSNVSFHLQIHSVLNMAVV